MDDIRMKYYSPVVVGKPGLQVPPTISSTGTSTNTNQSTGSTSFQDILQEKLQGSSNVNFSRHAVKRAADHGISLSQDSLNRLDEGVRLAGEKNLDDTLILVGDTAFVVNVPNKTVITAMNKDEMQGNVFTNINGTVII